MKLVSANVCNKTSLEFRTGIGNAIGNAIDVNMNVDITCHVWKKTRTPTKNDVEMAIEDIMDDC